MNLTKNFVMALAALGCGASAAGQAVIFPQQAQPGEARISESGSTYRLGNDLFDATFEVSPEGKLTFGGCPQMDLKGGTELFYVTLGDGTVVPASAMTVSGVKAVALAGDAEARRGSERIDGQALEATFTHGDLTIDWRAVLRDGSHYLRTEMELTAGADVAMTSIRPLAYTLTAGAPAARVVGNTRGAVIAGEKIFAGVETPTAYNSIMLAVDTPASDDAVYTISDRRSSRYVTDMADGSGLYGTTDVQEGSKWHFLGRADGKWDIKNAANGKYINNTAGNNTQLTTSATAPATGWEILRVNDEPEVAIANGTCQLHMTNNSRQFQVFNWGGGSKTDDDGCIFSLVDASAADTLGADTQLKGLWSRHTTLAAGKTWTVSAVVGLVAPGQQRRSFLAYSERERALPWRPMVHYNSWYELNINRNNSPTYDGHMTEEQCLEVVEQWRKNLFEKYDANITAFVWDDGWDEYGTWTFNKNFPNGFSRINEAAMAMNTGIGTWLGPVGGYGGSGTMRRNYWADKGGMQLSNPEYYNVFLDAVSNMTRDYDFRFFKLDGISAQFSSVGPDAGDTGNENAEGIIDIEQRVREINPDIFFNTTVGTWASPFWYRFSDATWRQENDYGEIGDASIDREKWITYRDRLVHQNYVVNSPLCPINTLMTHGVILSSHGAVSKNMSYAPALRELRCAFACGSAMIELYCDFERLNNIKKGQLWKDIADCIKWQQRNADVLPDAHWVGGNPWNGTSHEVYGWGAWNGQKAVLTLRNGANATQSFTLNLRKALDIPEYVTDPLVLSKSFDDIADLAGLPVGEPLDLDRDYEVTLPKYTLFMFDAVHHDATQDAITSPEAAAAASGSVYDLQGRPVANPSAPGIYIINGEKTLVK